MKLRELQKRFAQAIIEPLDVNENSSSDSQREWILESRVFSRSQRLGVYRYAYRARLQGAMAEDFSQVKEKMGDERFSAIVDQYFNKYPSRASSLSEVGRKFEKFLREQKNAKTRELADLAQEEWALICSFFSPDWGPQKKGELEIHPSVILLPGKIAFRDPRDERVYLKKVTPEQAQLLHYIKEQIPLDQLPELNSKQLELIRDGAAIGIMR